MGNYQRMRREDGPKDAINVPQIAVLAVLAWVLCLVLVLGLSRLMGLILGTG